MSYCFIIIMQILFAKCIQNQHYLISILPSVEQKFIGVTNKICWPMLFHVLMTDDLSRWSLETC